MSLQIEPDYEEYMFGTPGGAITSAVEIRAILDYLKPKENEKVLDIGTGTGRIARKIASYKTEIIGIDPMLTQIKLATVKKSSLGYRMENYQIAVAEGQSLPFKDSYFDAVVCIRTLKYFPNYQLGIKEICRVLKPGGRLIITLSNVYSIDFFLLKLGVLAYKTLFRFGSVKKIFLQNNFVIIEYLGLHKIHPKVWTWFKNPNMLALLKFAELFLQKITPKEFLSREILVKLIKKPIN